MNDKVKVFISWSGLLSQQVAQILRKWIPIFIQKIEPFVSSEDIEKGARWNPSITKELEESRCGVICLTKDNLNKSWLNFEAGALSNRTSDNRVMSFLFDLLPSDIIFSPLTQFQAAYFQRDEIKKLIGSLNTVADSYLSVEALDVLFDNMYPRLEEDLKNLLLGETDDIPEVDTSSSILEKLLQISGDTQRLIGNSEIKLNSSIDQLHKKIQEINTANEPQVELGSTRSFRKVRPVFLEELLIMLKRDEEFSSLFPYNLIIPLKCLSRGFSVAVRCGNRVDKVCAVKCIKGRKGYHNRQVRAAS